ncbi:hypothetical protein [Sessilibacter corallicola]|uniref:hypothetical protein n=1 Tax=Sessilibacter corallicola TaxID=2904075 RepID=UPI001E62867E|nr:hypothetical protein [Sessilibacter corallicola]MCE2029445.1 hypothetical protein [Sessilibacter corallicola]
MEIDFLLGLASGLVAAIITALIAKYWPSFVNIISKEAKINGSWAWYDSSHKEPIGNILIKQTGSKVKGQFERNKSIDGKTTKRVFKFEGALYGQILHINYNEPEDPKNVRGSIILKLVSGRQVFYGKTMYFENHKNEISTYNFVISKQDKSQPEAVQYLGHTSSEKSEKKNAA